MGRPLDANNWLPLRVPGTLPCVTCAAGCHCCGDCIRAVMVGLTTLRGGALTVIHELIPCIPLLSQCHSNPWGISTWRKLDKNYKVYSAKSRK
jgi:hypothetical protein